MSTIQITVTLDDETYRRAERLATLTGRSVADVLAETIDIAMPSLGAEQEKSPVLSQLSDAEVLARADSQMEETQDRRLSALLDHQQAGQLTPDDRAELLALMQVYEQGQLRKAQALHEAVRRGLRPPLEP